MSGAGVLWIMTLSVHTLMTRPSAPDTCDQTCSLWRCQHYSISIALRRDTPYTHWCYSVSTQDTKYDVDCVGCKDAKLIEC